jgi:hypothetical protein
VADHRRKREVSGIQFLADLWRIGVDFAKASADLCPLPVDRGLKAHVLGPERRP